MTLMTEDMKWNILVWYKHSIWRKERHIGSLRYKCEWVDNGQVREMWQQIEDEGEKHNMLTLHGIHGKGGVIYIGNINMAHRIIPVEGTKKN